MQFSIENTWNDDKLNKCISFKEIKCFKANTA